MWFVHIFTIVSWAKHLPSQPRRGVGIVFVLFFAFNHQRMPMSWLNALETGWTIMYDGTASLRSNSSPCYTQQSVWQHVTEHHVISRAWPPNTQTDSWMGHKQHCNNLRYKATDIYPDHWIALQQHALIIHYYKTTKKCEFIVTDVNYRCIGQNE